MKAPVEIKAIGITSARAACDRWHSHHEPSISGLFALAAWVGEPIAFDVVDQPAEDDGIDRAPEDTGDLWESCFSNDPEARHVYPDGDDVDAFAAEFDALQRQSLTGRMLRALDRAAGGVR